MECKKYSKLVIIIKKKQAHTENKLVVTRGKGEGQHKGGRVGGTSLWVSDRLKDVSLNSGDIANIL